jgi:hypothetical protein
MKKWIVAGVAMTSLAGCIDHNPNIGNQELRFVSEMCGAYWKIQYIRTKEDDIILFSCNQDPVERSVRRRDVMKYFNLKKLETGSSQSEQNNVSEDVQEPQWQ